MNYRFPNPFGASRRAGFARLSRTAWRSLCGAAVVLVALAPALLRGSVVGGAGTSLMACAGYSPRPCAPIDQATHPLQSLPVIFGATGNTGQVFILPESGERAVRVTDAMTDHAYNNYHDYYTWGTDSSAEANTWSALNPTCSFGAQGQGFGGDPCYLFIVYNQGGGSAIFAMDSKTMALQRLDGSAGSWPHGFTQGFNYGALKISNSATAQSYGNWAYTNPTVMYGVQSGTQLVKYDFANDAAGIQTLFNATSTACPGMPTITANYAQGLSQSNDDTQFSWFFGGSSQGDPRLVVDYNATTGACYWYDTVTSQVGGTGMATTTTGVGLLSPPTLTPSMITTGCSGTLQNGTYYLKMTGQVALHQAAGGNGETISSAEQSVSINCANNGSGSITVTGPSDWNTVAGNPYGLIINNWNLYASCQNAGATGGCLSSGASGAETLQKAGIACTASGNGGGAYTCSNTTLTFPLVSGAAPPTVSTAGYNIHQSRMDGRGQTVLISYQQGNTTFIWSPGTTTITWCNGGDGDTNQCDGHRVAGFAKYVNQDAPSGVGSLGLLIRPIGNISGWAGVNSLSYTAPTDGHQSWNNRNPTDTVPFLQVFYNSRACTGDGTTNLTNPCLAPNGPYDQELLLMATDGSNRVWRVAQPRAAPTPNTAAAQTQGNTLFGNQGICQINQDGRFALCKSALNWTLGQQGEGVVGGFNAWVASHSYAANYVITDGTNLECAKVGGTSGSTAPAWSSTPGTTITDGSVTWINLGPPGAPAIQSCGQTRLDVWVIETK